LFNSKLIESVLERPRPALRIKLLVVGHHPIEDPFEEMPCPLFSALYSLEEDWSEIVRNSHMLSEKARSQQTAMWELVETEVAYIRTLKVIQDVRIFCRPARRGGCFIICFLYLFVVFSALFELPVQPAEQLGTDRDRHREFVLQHSRDLCGQQGLLA
jgi:hypothetical protein